MTVKLATFSGWFGGKLGADIHAQLAEFNPHKISSPWKHGGWPSKRLLGWKTDSYIDKQAPDGPYVALGFSWGATAAARLAERDRRCVGLVFISGEAWQPANSVEWRFEYGVSEAGVVSLPAFSHARMVCRPWPEMPALCLCTHGEKRALMTGTAVTARRLREVGANVTCPDPAPNPGTHRKPHLAGVAHHLPEIRAFMDKHFGATEWQSH